MTARHHHTIVVARLASTRFPTQDLYIDKRQIPPHLVALSLDNKQITLLGGTHVGGVDIDGYASLGEPVGRGGGDDQATDPVDDGGGCGTVEDVFAVHERLRDGHMGFDVAGRDFLDYQLKAEAGKIDEGSVGECQLRNQAGQSTVAVGQHRYTVAMIEVLTSYSC